MATNYPAYTLEITPSKLADLEATINDIAKVIEVTPRDRKRFARLATEGKSFESVPIRTKLTDEEVARFVAQRFRFPGVEIKARLFRNYPHGELASHLVGYIGRINQEEKQKIIDDWSDEDQANYRGTEYIGKLGLEQSYESELHGITGFEQIETSAGGRAVRQLASKPATPGNTLAAVDRHPPAGARRGAVRRPSRRAGGDRSAQRRGAGLRLQAHVRPQPVRRRHRRRQLEGPERVARQAAAQPRHPRHLRAGLHLQPYMALAALTLGKRTAAWGMQDPGHDAFGNHVFHDDVPQGHGFVDMYQSIVKSCDIYYFMLANDIGVDNIASFMAPFGFGSPTGIDLQGELRGVLPSTDWKRKAYRRPEQQKWYAGETISLGIGQGYNNYTIMQLANALATLSTGGQRHTPHLVRDVVDVVSGARHPVAPTPLEPLKLNPDFVEVIRNAMVGVNREGTGAAAFAQRRLRLGRQDGDRAGGQHQGQREVQRGQGGRVPARQRALHLLRARRPADHRHRAWWSRTSRASAPSTRAPSRAA